MDKFNIEKNDYGFFQVQNKPSEKELNEFYEKKYYQNNHGLYKKIYSDEEITYLNSVNERYYFLISKFSKLINILDVGCGEGFLVDFFRKKGHEVFGIDFSDNGIISHNEHLLNNFKKGDVFKILDDFYSQNIKYSAVIIQNVLEHVLDPKECLLSMKNILDDDGILVIRVPNDFSETQKYLLNNNHISDEYWICPPEHLSYFNLDSLIKFSNDCGYDVVYYMSDYPIDFDLFIDSTNYIEQKKSGNNEVGKQSHLKRIRVENFLNSISIQKTCDYYKSLADLGLGREIIVFLKKKICSI
jgi:2-polyprenyl-3-methyl-5-hydroxy-6-metoxy-1,4-benzoquinol methylase